MATHLAACVAGVTWSVLDRFFHKKPTTLGMITGAVAGLVSITPAAGFVTPMGAIATGLGANKLANPDKPGNWQGLFQGNPAQLWIQVQAAVVTMVFSFLVSLALLKRVDVVMGLRVSDHEERVGLDLTQHKETGYTVVD